MNFIAYLIRNEITGLCYIGITSNKLVRRWEGHRTAAKSGAPTKMAAAIREYGYKSFTITHIASSATWTDLQQVEKSLIADRKTLYPHGYNLTEGGEGIVGYKFSAESLKRLAEAHIGNRHTEHAKKLIAASSKGRRHSTETRQKMSAIQKSVWENRTPEEVARRMAVMVEIGRRPESRAKRRIALEKMLQDSEKAKIWFNANRGKRPQVSKDRMRTARNSFLQNNPVRARELTGKITAVDVANIKWRLIAGDTAREIAEDYPVCKGQIYAIKYGLCWADVRPGVCRSRFSTVVKDNQKAAVICH